MYALMKLYDFASHLNSEFGVEVGKRFVHKEKFRLSYDRSAQSNSLHLTAGKFFRFSVEILSEIENFGRVENFFLYFFFRVMAKIFYGIAVFVRYDVAVFILFNILCLFRFEREGDIFENGHVGIQRVVLENHRYISVLAREIISHYSVDVKVARSYFFKSRYHS